MNKSVDVFVIGGGPAGLVVAIAARQQGLSVMVADGADHPIDKPCGEGLIPETQVCAEYPRDKGIGIRRTVLHELLVAKAEEREEKSKRNRKRYSSEFKAKVALAAPKRGSDAVGNTDQGSQFTSAEFVGVLENAGVQSPWMAVAGGWMDNVMVERRWRSLKYENVYLIAYETGTSASQGGRHPFFGNSGGVWPGMAPGKC